VFVIRDCGGDFDPKYHSPYMERTVGTAVIGATWSLPIALAKVVSQSGFAYLRSVNLPGMLMVRAQPAFRRGLRESLGYLRPLADKADSAPPSISPFAVTVRPEVGEMMPCGAIPQTLWVKFFAVGWRNRLGRPAPRPIGTTERATGRTGPQLPEGL
jgi:hypothetical protein